MTAQSRVSVSWTVLAALAVALLAAGAGATYFGTRPTLQAVPEPTAAADATTSHDHGADTAGEPPSSPVATAALPDVVVTLSQDAVDRARITVSTVTAGRAKDHLRAPGVVEPNAYQVVVVTPLLPGRITRVMAELGQRVVRGQAMAQIFSPELAEAQMRYVSVRAELEAHERVVARTEKLVEIGAASRQELEGEHAAHAAHLTGVQAAASRLELLGRSVTDIDHTGHGGAVEATIDVPAPMDGVVIERAANVGLNVDPATKLFTVVDLSNVWVIADVYERDFARVRVGTPATVTTTSYPDLALRGRVSYIDPQVNPDTRTARARIEVSNARRDLRLGMYVDALFAGAGGASTPMIPAGAVQHVGDRTVVYLVDPSEPGRFVERDVRLGTADGGRVAVLAGVAVGDVVVGEGSFSVRAERERLGLRR